MFDHFHTIELLIRTGIYNERYIDMDHKITKNKILKEFIDSSTDTLRKNNFLDAVAKKKITFFRFFVFKRISQNSKKE